MVLMPKTDCKALRFPNSSRSYDVTAHGVRFWGYDQALEVSFFIEEGALTKICSGELYNQRGVLRTFDLNVGRIREVARLLYVRRRKDSHVFSFTLKETDFQ